MRRSLNWFTRKAKGLVSRRRLRPPQVGETLVCLRNDYSVIDPVFNGSTWTVTAAEHDVVENDDDEIAVVRLDLTSPYAGTTKVVVPLECFGATDSFQRSYRFQNFDYGYALTVHKAQGSEWGHVALIEESACFREHARRWLYRKSPAP